MNKKKNIKTIWNKKHPVYYQFIDNNAEETVVFIHGLFSTSSIFKYFTKFINKNIILLEVRGIVYSKIKKPYLRNYANDIKLILENENIKKATMIGYSLGCSIANEFAEKYSNMVDTIIMLAPINKTFKEIGKKTLVKTLLYGLGKDFFKKWREYLSLEKKCAPWRIFNIFNFKLLKDAYKHIKFTNKCKIIILNGKQDTFFNFQDSGLKLPNIMHEQIGNLDHFLFIRRHRIQKIAKYIMPHLISSR